MLGFDDIDKAAREIRSWMTDAEVHTARKRIEQKYASHPLTRQYVNHLDEPNSRNTEPWHAVGEQLYASFLASVVGLGEISLVGQVVQEPAANIRAALGLSAVMMLSTPYLWTREIEDLADSTPLPQHIISRTALPHPSMFWSRETSSVTNMDGEAGQNNWFYLQHHPEGILLVTDRVLDKQRMNFVAAMIPYGKTYPDEFEAGIDLEAVRIILSRLAFLASPYIDQAPRRLPRPTRRELARGQKREPRELDPIIYTVTLRRKSPEPETRSVDDPTKIDWKHHWWVSGHFRKQWIPTEQAHRIIWIAPYLKGDFDKPLLNKVYAVVR